jgi:hypothetical protein
MTKRDCQQQIEQENDFEAFFAQAPAHSSKHFADQGRRDAVFAWKKLKDPLMQKNTLFGQAD